MAEVNVLNIDELLKDFGLDRQMLIQKNAKYEADFKKLDGYYDRYTADPTEGVGNAVNSIVISFMKKLKDENPEIFDVKVEQIPEEELQESNFGEHKKDFIFFIEQGNQDAIDDLFNEIGTDKTKRLISTDNFKSYLASLKTRNTLIINYLTESMEALGIFSSAIIARDGVILTQIFANGDMPLIQKALDALKQNPAEAKIILHKIKALEQVMEMGDEKLTDQVEAMYSELGVGKKVKAEKASKVVQEQSAIKNLIASITAGTLVLDIPLVSRLEKKTAMIMLTTAEQIAAGETYRFVVQTPFKPYFEGKEIYSDPQYTVFEKNPDDFEKQFGISVYELGFAWFNMKNLLSIDDIMAMMYVANISMDLMVARDNAKLRTEFKAQLKEIFEKPDINKINGRFYQLTQSNIKSLHRSGFLDNDYCPTKLLYCAMALHAFPFPAYTHPFEFVSIDTFSSQFQFQVLKGEFGNESFYTDGDILLHNFQPGANPPESTMALVDLSRTVILNLKSNGRSDIKKTRAVINHFIPFLYTIPKSGLSIPTFTIKTLDVENRRINWGVYEFADDHGQKVYVNSYAIDNFLSRIKNADPDIYMYRGELSEQILSNPKDGIIIHYDKKFVATRGINRISFLSENFGKNWEKYYKEMFTKKHLENQVLHQMKPEFVKALYVNTDTRVENVNPNLLFKNLKELEKPIEIAKAVKQEPAPVPPAAVEQKDDRIYIGKRQSRDDLDKALWPIYDKVSSVTGPDRDEAILDELYGSKIDRIFPDQLVLLGFDLKQWALTKNKVKYKDKYLLRIPNLLSWTYYIEKI